MADTTAPAAEPAPEVSSTESKPEKAVTTESTTEAPTEPATTMSGALQTPDADVTKAPEASEESKVNGEATETTTEDKPTEATEDTELKDSAVDETTGEAADATKTNGAPASAKKQTDQKRKSLGGSTGKKLSKKKSIPKITHLDAKPGEFYFARLKSYPPWPSIICDEDMLPTSLLSTRPVTTKQADGTYKEPFAEGGKRVMERTFPIMFLHTNEFAWIPNTDLTPLDPEECKDVSDKGKSKSLIAAYKVAAEGHDLEYYKTMLADHQRAMDEDQALREERAAEKAAKEAAKEAAKAATKSEGKKKRKSTDAATAAAADGDGDVEMEDAGDEEGAAKPKSTKKRKKDAESDGDGEKPAKTPKTATKLKLTTPKAPTPAESSKKGKESAKPKKTKTPAKKAAKSEEEATPAPKEPEKPLDPIQLKAKKENRVLYLRHRLQKGFLSREQAPKEDEMKTMSDYMTELEEHGNLEVSIIRKTKVNKLLKAIIKLNTIPKDEEFNFRKRSHDLLESWSKLLGAEPAEAGSSKDAEPTTNGANGVHKDEDAEGEAASSDAKPAADSATDGADSAVADKPADDDNESDEAKPSEEAPKEEPEAVQA